MENPSSFVFLLMDSVLFHHNTHYFKKKKKGISSLFFSDEQVKFHIYNIHHQLSIDKVCGILSILPWRNMFCKYQVLLQQAFNYIVFQCVNINQNETWNLEERKQMKWFRIKTLDLDVSALVYQRDQSLCFFLFFFFWFHFNLWTRTGVEFWLLVLFSYYFIYINRSGLGI